MSDDTVMSFDEGNAACPFVAFQDDRDHRSDFADSRHRCYAAAEPEPRETSHQERFCLSVAFAACPVFLEWARAEAAGVSGGRPASAAGGAAGFAAITAAGKAASRAASDTPAFLANRGRTTPAEAAPVTAHASDPGSGLWGFEGAPKRTVAPASAPAIASSSFDMGPPMARRQPTKPDWENPPKYDNFPRLRARDDRNNNQPLLLAALGVAVLMVALILVPLITPKGGGGASSPSASGPAQASQSLVVSSSPTTAADRTFYAYHVRSGDNLNAIAAKYGISYAQLLAANPQITNPNRILVGDIVYIPWQTWVPSPSPTPTATPTPTPTPTPYITPYH